VCGRSRALSDLAIRLLEGIDKKGSAKGWDGPRLQGMRQLVRHEPTAPIGVGPVLAVGEADVAADRERPRPKATAPLPGFEPGMDSHRREIRTKGAPEPVPNRARERAAGAAQDGWRRVPGPRLGSESEGRGESAGAGNGQFRRALGHPFFGVRGLAQPVARGARASAPRQRRGWRSPEHERPPRPRQRSARRRFPPDGEYPLHHWPEPVAGRSYMSRLLMSLKEVAICIR
jgi:hypothetical protein